MVDRRDVDSERISSRNDDPLDLLGDGAFAEPPIEPGSDSGQMTGSTGSDSGTKSQQKAGDAKEKAGQAQEKASEVAGQAQQKAGEAKQKAGEVAGQAQEKAGEVAGQAQEKADQGVASAASGLGKAAETLRAQGEQRGGSVGSAATTAAEQLDQASSYLQDKDTDQLMSDLEALVRRKPVESMLVAAGAGFILSKIFS